MIAPKLKIWLIGWLIFQLVVSINPFSSRRAFPLVQRAAAQNNSSDSQTSATILNDDVLTPKEENHYYQTAKSQLTNQEQKNLQLISQLTRINQDLSAFNPDGTPRLILNSTDLDILKSKIDFSLSEKLISSQDDRLLTQLANQLESTVDLDKLINATDMALKKIAAPRLKEIIRFAKQKFLAAKTETHLSSAEKEAKITAAKEQIFDLAADKNYQSANPQQKKYQDLELDRRTLEALLYLIKPSAEGGAGHEQIQISHIWSGFETPGQSPNDHPTAQSEDNPHFKGQAFDVSSIDTIKCTLIKKKRIGHNKKLAQPARPILVQYQTKEGVNQLRSPYGNSMNEVFQNLTRGDLADLYAGLGLTPEIINPDDPEHASVEDLGVYLGENFIQQVLGISQPLRGKNISDITRQFGKSYLEKNFNLPKESFQGKSLDELLQNIGRRQLEDNLRLPRHSLQGRRGNEILVQLGKKYYQKQTRGLSEADLRQLYHNRIDEALGFPSGSWEKIKQGDQSPYLKIGIQLIARQISTNDQDREAIRGFLLNQPIELTGWEKTSPQAVIALTSTASQQNVFNRIFKPEYEKVYQPACRQAGGDSSWEFIRLASRKGKSTVAYHCRKQFSEQDLPAAAILRASGLTVTDFSRLFGGSGAPEVFRQLGKKIFVSRLKDQTALKQKENDLLIEHPELIEITADWQFRRQALKQAKSYLDKTQTLLQQNHFDDSLQTLNQKNQAELNRLIDNQPASFLILETNINTLTRRLDEINQQIEQSNSPSQLLTGSLAQAYAYLRAALEGKSVNLSPAQLGLPTNQTKTARDARALLASVLTSQNSPSQAALLYGSTQLAQKLNLPVGSFDFLIHTPQSLDKITPQVFYQAIGKAQIKISLGQKTPQQAAKSLSPSVIDYQLGISPGLTQKLIQGKLSQDAYEKQVGKTKLKYSAISTALHQRFQAGRAYLTPEDIYQLLSGHPNTVLNQISGLILDRKLNLMPGRGEAFFNASSASERKEILSQIGLDWVNHWLGIDPFTIGDHPLRALAASKLEKTLGLKSGSLSQSQNLEEIIKYNSALAFANAFHLPLPFSDNYSQAQFKKDLQLSGLKNSPRESDRQQARQAIARLEKFRQDVNQQISIIRQPNSIWWQDKEKLKQNQTLSPTIKKKILDFQYQIQALDARLRLKNGTTQRFLTNQIQLDDYLTETAHQTINYLVSQANLGNKLADWLGITNQQERQKFINNLSGLYRAIQGDQGAIQTIKENSLQLFSAYLDDRFGFNQPGHPFSLTDILIRRQNVKDLLIEEGIYRLGIQLDGGGASGELATSLINYYQNGNKQLLEANIRNFAARKLSNHFFNENDIKLIGSDITRLMKDGDVRLIPAIAGVQLIKQSANLNKQGQTIPVEMIPSWQDFRSAFLGQATDRQSIDSAGDKAFNTVLDKYQQPGAAELARQTARQKEAARLAKIYQQTIQYKLLDIQLWKLDPHIPTGFSQAMLNGSPQDKTVKLSELASNYLTDSPLLKEMVNLDTDAIKQLNDWVNHPTPENWNKTVKKSLHSVENFLNLNNRLGFKLQPGTLKAINLGYRTSNWQELEGLYRDWGTNKIFSIADTKLNLPTGSTVAIYKNYQNFQTSLANYQKIKNAAENGALPNQDLTKAKNQLKNAKLQLQNFSLTLAINQLFGKKMAQLDNKLGLVPGTFSTVINGLVLGVDPLTTIIVVLALNLFGVYKTELLCTGDGYYPALGPPSDPALNLNTGVFNGKDSASYQQGVMKAAQAKVNDLISDMLDFGYHYKNGGHFNPNFYSQPDELTKPIQIITFRQADFNAFFGTKRYREVFNRQPPSTDNLQGIGISKKIPHLIHIGF